MSNELFFLLEVILSFSLLIICYKLFSRTGLYIWIVISTVLANIQVAVTIGLFGMVATLGNVIYGTSFLATDILSEKYGIKSARRGVLIGFFVNVTTMLLMQWVIRYTPHATDFMMQHLREIFLIFPRVVAGSLAAYLISQLHDTWAFEFWKQRFPNLLWLRNIASTVVSQALDTAVFVLIAFYGVFEFDVVLSIAISTYVLKFAVAVLDTPFMYLAAGMKKFVFEKEEV